MTLRSAARPRRALARHSAGTYISSGTLQNHLCLTPITLVIHLFLSPSHFFHLWVTWLAKCRVNASKLSYQGLEASFYKAFTNSLVLSKGFTYLGPLDFITMPLLSLCGLFPKIPRSFSLFEACCLNNDWTKMAQTFMRLSVILLPISVSGKTIDYFLHVLHFFIKGDPEIAFYWSYRSINCVLYLTF